MACLEQREYTLSVITPRSTAVKNVYEHRGVPLAFDLLIATLFAPFGGIGQVRRAAVKRLAPVRGSPILELGCGTGSVTRLLIAQGAVVTAIDRSANMLTRARRRAPGARFELQDLQDLSLASQHYAGAIAAFVLHELSAEARLAALRRSCCALVPGGRLVLLDHAVPERGAIAGAWRRLLLKLEPPSVRDVIANGYTAELHSAGFTDVVEVALAAGTARLWVARRP